VRNPGSPDQQNSQVTAPHHRSRPNRVLSQDATDLDQLLSDRYPDEHLADEFHQRHQDARTALRRKTHTDS
jgi:hypothetical protein